MINIFQFLKTTFEMGNSSITKTEF